MLKYSEISDEIGLSLGQVKMNLQVLHDAHDDYIADLMVAAIALLEGRYGLSIYRQQIWLYVEKFVGLDGRIELVQANEAKLLSVNYFDVDGAPQVFDLAKVRQSQNMTNFLNLKPRAGSCWPDHYPQFGDVVVKYEAGWAAEADNMPVCIFQAIKLIVGEWYVERKAITDAKKHELPHGVMAIMQRFKTI